MIELIYSKQVDFWDFFFDNQYFMRRADLE